MTSLDDLSLFLSVADTGSLSAASEATGMPLPTLSRRMKGLEADLAQPLFLRGAGGFALTPEGEALAKAAAGLHGVRRALDRWREHETGPTPVRITGGLWTSQHLARHLTLGSGQDWVPQFLPSNNQLDLARRAADIGLRNSEPDHPWLARKRLRRIDYAIYAAPDAPQTFITLPRGGMVAPSQRWVHTHHGDAIVTTATDPRLCLDLAQAGHGQVVLPCFVGAIQPMLEQRSDPIPDLAHDEWLVSHQDTRHLPAIRAALRAIEHCLLTEN